MTIRELQVNCQDHRPEILIFKLRCIYFLREDYLNTNLDKLGPKVMIEIQTRPLLETGKKNFGELTSIWVMAPR
jgi:hypothetical protein